MAEPADVLREYFARLFRTHEAEGGNKTTFAARLGMTRGNVNMLLASGHNVNAKTLGAICRYEQIDPAALFTRLAKLAIDLDVGERPPAPVHAVPLPGGGAARAGVVSGGPASPRRRSPRTQPDSDTPPPSPPTPRSPQR